MTTPLPDLPLCPHDIVLPPSPQHMPGCPQCLWIELATANETNASLHRRTQLAESELARLRKACAAESHEITQLLGKALRYPWFRDDQANFPGATEADGVCVGEHVPVTLAMEAATKIAELTAEITQWRARAVNDLAGQEHRIETAVRAWKEATEEVERLRAENVRLTAELARLQPPPKPKGGVAAIIGKWPEPNTETDEQIEDALRRMS